MSGLFSSPAKPTPMATPPPPPTASSPDTDIAARQQMIALQRGRTATMLTGGAGLANMGNTSKTLLGQ